MTDLYFTGVGSRKMPANLIPIIDNLAQLLIQANYTLRSGGADGADTFWENAYVKYSGKMEIYLPKKNFNKNYSKLFTVCNEAKNIAKQFHPVWHVLDEYSQLLHGRNVYQVLGLDLNTPSKFVLAWTADYCESHATRSRETGGTGTAISVASHYGIPVINMSRKNWYDKLTNYL